VVWARNSGFTDVEEAGAQEVMGNSKAKWDSAYDNDVKRRRVAAMQAKTMALAAGEAVRRGLHLNPSWGCQPEPDFQDLPSETDSDDPHSDETLSRRAAVERGAHGQERRDKRIARREVARHGSKRLSHESGGDGGMKRRRGEDSPVGQQRRRDHQRDESEPQPAWRQSPPARGVGGDEYSPVGQQRRRDHQRDESEPQPAWRQSPPARGVGGDEYSPVGQQRRRDHQRDESEPQPAWRQSPPARGVGGDEYSPVGQQRRRDHQRDESEPQPGWRQSPSARGVGGDEDSPVGQQRRRDHQRDESEPQPAWRQSPSARGVGGGEDSPVGQLHGKVTEAEAALMGRPALKTAWTLKYGRGTTSGNGDWLRRSLVGTVLPRAPRAGTAHGRLDLLTAAAALSGGGGREEEEEEEEEEVETPETGSYVSDGSSETLDD
jgi:hypothetical protein